MKKLALLFMSFMLLTVLSGCFHETASDSSTAETPVAEEEAAG